MMSTTSRLAVGDELLYRYEGEVLPYDKSAGWIVVDACDGVCTEAIGNGRLVFRWPEQGDLVYYHLWIAKSGEPSPPSLWAECRFRSNFPLGPFFFRCAAKFSVVYLQLADLINLYGDAVIAQSGFDFVLGLELGEFHTYRFESSDGAQFAFFVDGNEIWRSTGNDKRDLTYIQFGGDGGCGSDWIPNMVNEWDFIRYGTISSGEPIERSEPPAGLLDARKNAALDRILVTFEEPAYVYVDEIGIDVTDLTTPSAVGAVELPNVRATRRREPPDPFDVEDDPRIVEIVLDRPVPFNATTRFTLDDGTVVNTFEYTFALADANGTGTVDLADIAHLQNCAGSDDATGVCGVFDLDRSGVLDFADSVGVISTMLCSMIIRGQK